MKKIFLSICLLSFLISTPNISTPQDAKLWLGGSYIRFDSDSNLIRFGGVSLYPKIARELNAQLFNFNTNHFSWSTSTGLNLVNVPNNDSLWANKLTVVKDTGDGEFSPYLSRHYTLKKPLYINLYDNYDLMWFYRSSTASPVLQDSMWAINTYVNYPEEDFSSSALSSSFSLLRTFRIPKPGHWLITINYEYSFPEASSSAGTLTDSLCTKINIAAYTYATNCHKLVFPELVYAGGQFFASISKVIYISAPETDIQFQALCSEASGSKPKIIKVYATATLIR